MIINFKCKKCKKVYDSEVGEISIDVEKMRPIFEYDIECPTCGKRSLDEVLLTELGQGQLTSATIDL